MKLTLIFCMLLTFFYAGAQKKRPLLQLAKGQTYYLEGIAASTSLQSIGGRESKVNTTTSFRVAFTVTNIADTLYNLEGRYQQLTMKIRLADTTLNMSSQLGSKPDTASVIMSEIVNKPFVVVMTQGGTIEFIKNLDELITKAVDGFPALGSLKKDKVASQFIQAFGAASVKGVLKTGAAVLPAKPIAKGDKWMSNSTISSPAAAEVHINYQLIDVTPDTYFIRGEGIISAEKNPKPAELNGIPATYNLNGSLLSEIKIDQHTGWITEVKLKQLIEENIEIPGNPKVPGGMTIPMMFTIEMTISGKP